MKDPIKIRKLVKEYYIFIRDFLSALFQDKLSYYSASLSFYTLFSIIPLLVIVLSIFTNLPLFEEVYLGIQNLLFENLMPTHSKEVLTHINGFVENSGKLGMVGVIYVLFASMMFFKNYDYIVNDIFESKRRSFWSSVTIYWTLVTLTPIMMVLSFYVSMQIQVILNKNHFTDGIHLLEILPFFIIWSIFFLTYKISANALISNKSAGISSFIASLVWYIAKSGFIFYVFHNKTYMSIYGSLSTLLFFFLWIYISWAIFLHGMKFCHLLDDDKEIETMKDN
ncbi:MAG: Inner membrane protein YihY, formerly thought to be RNase BN [uncultured Sulfurovum sp.]|uniref:Inner membrane protein YihY, formerly thought to be RNase BN n=1 Tax=uncultured Sulfurovum sp. TaxID=269237 RepID=A0A6S6TLG1_9BACT|nr:MAG: Inner membrane protein YihY, formerly thought to be RNase BN [uncultured Sulfurovum sp.]